MHGQKYELTNRLFMEQVIITTTRENNIQNLCFTNNVDLIHNVELIPTTLSEHDIVELNMYGLGELLASTLSGIVMPYTAWISTTQNGNQSAKRFSARFSETEKTIVRHTQDLNVNK